MTELDKILDYISVLTEIKDYLEFNSMSKDLIKSATGLELALFNHITNTRGGNHHVHG